MPDFNFDNTYTRLSPKLFSAAQPARVPSPALLLFNEALVQDLGLSFRQTDADYLAQLLSGQVQAEGSMPVAQAYAGHQFGHFTMLGDGRAILLGEHVTHDGRRVDIQLKGSGQTHYSRRGDGKATLSAMLREYLISEAIHYLHILSSRSLAVVATGEPVFREIPHRGAVLTRVMTSHIRVGTFEYVRHLLPAEALEPFIDYVIDRHFPDLKTAENKALALLAAVIDRQIDLIVQWMRVGFIHGVMNTDNMSIAGETFDYGPCAFMNAYRYDRVFSSIDKNGRYAYGNQPSIAQWNLACLASALLPAIDTDEQKAVAAVQPLLDAFPETYTERWWSMMAHKTGFAFIGDAEKTLIARLLQWMEDHGADYTNTFLMLQGDLAEPDALYKHPSFKQWTADWMDALEKQHNKRADAIAVMRQHNPIYIARNHQVEQALNNACLQHDFTLYNQILAALRQPYTRDPASDFLQRVPAEVDAGYATFCNT
jgi:serine/tyrosine/threonine adenylyltransferase